MSLLLERGGLFRECERNTADVSRGQVQRCVWEELTESTRNIKYERIVNMIVRKTMPDQYLRRLMERN